VAGVLFAEYVGLRGIGEEGAESRKQKAESRRQKLEGVRQKGEGAKGKKQKAEVIRNEVENREAKRREAKGRGQKATKRQKAEGRSGGDGIIYVCKCRGELLTSDDF